MNEVENLTLSDHHIDMMGNYLKFAKFRRGKHLRMIDQTFDDIKLSRLEEGTFTADEIKEMMDELCALLKGDMELELINTAHTAALLLCQMCCQAQQWHLKLNADISELENRDLLDKVNKFEEKVISSSSLDKSLTGSPLRLNKLQPMADNSGATQLLHVEIEKLKSENKKLCIKLEDLERQTVEILEKKTELATKLAETQFELKEIQQGKEEDVEKDLRFLEDEMVKVKEELETTMSSNAYTQQALENDLEDTKENLLTVQAQLNLAEKELENRLNETGAFKNLKKMLATKNDQIKTLRLRLQKYEEDVED